MTTDLKNADIEIHSVDKWQADFDGAAKFVNRKYLPMSLSADSRVHYNLSYIVDAQIQMFRATCKTEYLDVALHLISNVIQTSIVSSKLPGSQYKDNYQAWPNLSSKSAIQGREFALFESYFWRYGCSALKAMKERGLQFDDNYQLQYNKILHFIETHIFLKWLDRDVSTIYRSRTHMTCHWAYIAMLLVECSNDDQLKFSAKHVLDNINYRGFPSGMHKGSNLADQFYVCSVCPHCVSWYKDWVNGSDFKKRVQDVAHGNGVIAYLVESVDSGSYWGKKDVAGIIATMKKSLLVAPYSKNVDGTGVGSGWIVDGFVKLGRFDVELQQMLERHSGKGVNGPVYAAGMAFNASQLMR